VSSGGRAGDEVTDCDGCLFGYGRLWGDLEVAGESGTKSVDARVDFSGDEGSVSVLPIKVWGGEVTAGGTLGLLDGAWGLDLWSGGRRIAYEDDGVKGLVNFDLALSGPLNSPSISGAFQVDEGKVDLLRLPTLPSLGATKQGSARRGYDPSLDLQIEIEAAEVSAGTFLKGQMAGAVGIKGSVKDPQLFGEVALIRGDFRYLGSRFDATVGTVQFRGANLPRLEMVGTRKVGDVKITAAVSGPADDLKLHLSSDPPLAQSEILELLNVPASVDMSEGWGELARSLANLANAELASQVYWRLGQAVENALDLDQFRVDQNGGAVQLTIGKYVNPDLYLSYTRTLGGAASQDIAAEYRIGPNMTLTSEWDFEEKRDVGIEISVPF